MTGQREIEGKTWQEQEDKSDDGKDKGRQTPKGQTRTKQKRTQLSTEYNTAKLNTANIRTVQHTVTHRNKVARNSCDDLAADSITL